jgi:hypothetical protein
VVYCSLKEASNAQLPLKIISTLDPGMTGFEAFRMLCINAVAFFVLLSACYTYQAGNTALIQAAWEGDT